MFLPPRILDCLNNKEGDTSKTGLSIQIHAVVMCWDHFQMQMEWT